VNNGTSTSWWDDPTTDWTSGDPARAVALLARAYDDPEAVASIAGPAGLDPPEMSSGESMQQRWIAILVEAAARGRTLDLVVEVLRDGRSSAFHAPFEALLGDLLGRANALRARRYGLPPEPSGPRDRVLESLKDAGTVPGAEPLDALEAITSLSATLQDPRESIQAILAAMNRTAMIEVAGQPRGTGFLIGPDLLLTAAHVIEARRWPPNPLPEAWAHFDYAYDASRPSSQAETGIRIRVEDFVTASLPTAAEVAGTDADWNAPRGNLDFALLRLGEPVPVASDGGHRGAYHLDATDYNFAGSPLLFIVQHPLGEDQKVTFLRGHTERNTNRTRIRYGGITLQGSSGSPVVDIRGRLVALHHYGGRGVNQAVPLSMIAKMLVEGPHRELVLAASQGRRTESAVNPVSEYDPFVTTELMSRPFVDRANLRARLGEMVRTNAPNRTLAITGESGSGVSYSYDLTAHVAVSAKLCKKLRDAAPGGLVARRIDLRDFVGMSVEERGWHVSSALLAAFGLSRPQDQLAQEARSVTTVISWVQNKLSESDQQWWIFFDSVDNLVATELGKVDELIHAMIKLSDDPQVSLRVVVAGREAQRFAEGRTAWLENDFARGLSRGDVEDWLRVRAQQAGRAIDEARLSAELTTLFPPGGAPPEPRRLAVMLPIVLDGVIVGADDGS
jgi:hypothetical protein